MIPKKIHYCWFGKKTFPKLVRKCIATWHKHLSDYEFCLWNEENSPMDIPFVKDAYKAKKYAFVADYVRFWALYNHGGIYLDTDMFVVKSFNNLLNNNVFFAYEQEKLSLVGNGVIGSVKNNSFIKKIMEQYEQEKFDPNNLGKIIIPNIVTPCYNQYQNKEEITIYLFDYFHPFPFTEKRNIKQFLDYKTSNTYAIHLWNFSWYPWYKKIVRETMIYFKKIIS